MYVGYSTILVGVLILTIAANLSVNITFCLVHVTTVFI